MSLSSRIIEWFKKEFDGGEYKPEEKPCYQRSAFYTLLGVVVSTGLLYGLKGLILPCPTWLRILYGSLPYQLFGIVGALLGLKGVQWNCRSSSQPFTTKLLFKKLGLCMLLVLISNAIVYVIYSYLGLPFTRQNLVQIISNHRTLSILLSAGFIAIIMAPLAEELAFRVVLYRYLRCLGDGYAVVFTALIFASLHGQWQMVPALFSLGCMLQHTCNLYGYKASVLLHCAFNLVGLLGIACR